MMAEFFFRMRGYTPLPLLILLLLKAQPRLLSYLAGWVLVGLGEGVRLWSVSYTGAGTRGRTVGAERLVTTGPYAYVRNPIYLGNFILSLGFCIMAWAWMPYMVLLFLGAFGIQYGLIIFLEEAHLRQVFADAYAAYAAQVPRFVPQWRRYPGATPQRANLKAAIQSDRRTLQAILVVALAILGVAWLRG